MVPQGQADVQQDVVRSAWQMWSTVTPGLQFRELPSNDWMSASVKIEFGSDSRAWSLLGRDCLNYPSEATMHFGWDISNDLDTALHEIGHALGFHHEHQNPNSGIKWNRAAVLRYFRGSPNNWTEAMIEHNVLKQQLPNNVDGSTWDPKSIMHYEFGPGLIDEPEEHKRNGIHPPGGLSDLDKHTAKVLYPAVFAMTPLPAYTFVDLKLKEGQEHQCTIEVDQTMEYQIQTFTKSDSLLVLYEAPDIGKFETYIPLERDEDVSSDRNASITKRLEQGKRYVLTVRLYSKFGEGKFGLLMTGR